MICELWANYDFSKDNGGWQVNRLYNKLLIESEKVNVQAVLMTMGELWIIHNVK